MHFSSLLCRCCLCGSRLQSVCKIKSEAVLSHLQGIAFFHAGSDILRSKSLDRDSYNSGKYGQCLQFHTRGCTAATSCSITSCYALLPAQTSVGGGCTVPSPSVLTGTVAATE